MDITFANVAGFFIAAISLLAVCATLKKAKHPLRSALCSSGCGIAALGAVNLLSIYTGVSIALNYATAFVVVVLGVPGVICMLFMKVLLM